MKLNDIRVSRKLLVSNIVALVLLCLTALWMEQSTTRAFKDAAHSVEELEKVVALGTEWKGLSDATMQRNIALALSDSPVLTKLFKPQITHGISTISTLLEELMQVANRPGDKEAFAKVGEARKSVLADLTKIDQLKEAGDTQAVEPFIESAMLVDLAAYLKSLDDFVSLQKVHRKEAEAEAAMAQAYAEWTSLGLMVLVAVASFAWIAGVSNSIVRPLREAVHVANAIAGGDLTQELKAEQRKDEVGALISSLSAMSVKLRQVVSEVRVGVESVSAASHEIADGNSDLSSRTEQAAANLEEAASSMEELTGTVSQTAESALQARMLANSAVEAAGRGNHVVDDVVAHMKEISESSNRISEIIGTIDSIAFQTNILALNAAVEAARAGEQGRGFAVVAGEVRALAGRSAEAAKQIKALITTSVEKVGAGAQLVSQTGEVMSEIVSSVKRATDMMNEIAAASTEQRDGISQVNQSVTQLDEVTQQNAALVEQSAAAAASLQDQARNLAGLVAMFNVGNQTSARILTVTEAPHRTALSPAAPPATPKAASPQQEKTAPGSGVSEPSLREEWLGF